ncbi:SSrecog-domain-containing protein [Sanghuangporus baumii]|uniref:FACT complex subunit POB3 n=1 Tax=Sanghuangporus baumii TaxID=108892 RepID=A0A9Q5HZI9_SANBA|nr:SSrecog-domain-containing protein [Sanghuangporus baumii]
MTTQFDNIYHELEPQVGKFRMAASGMAWMNSETKAVVSVPAGEIKWAQWMRVARNFRLRIGLKEKGKRENFDGFMRDDHDKLTSLMKQHYGIILETKEITFKGWNWGATDFQGQDLAFLVSNKTAFELPLQKVANSNIAGRTEVSLEFATSAASRPSKSAADELVEIRFYVPGTSTKETGSDAGEEQGEGDEEETSAAQAFHDAVKEKADLGEVSGDMIVNFEEILVLTPRGRYDMDMFPDFLRLRGKTYDYKINYDGISKLFLLPKDDQHVLFILSLMNPIRQGQTRYHFLVMQFDREEEIKAELNIDDEELEKYEKLQKSYESSSFEVVSSIFRSLSRNKIIGSGSYSSRTGHPGIKANLKAVQGDLFILEKYIFFVAKTPLLIEFSDIHQVTFSRVGGPMATSRTFDLVIVTKSGPEHTFSSINKEEHENLEGYLKGKKLRVKSTMAEDLAAPALDDDEDEEMQSVVSSGDEVPRPRLGGDDDDSEEDEDFQASSSDNGSPSSESESDDDGAASVSDASGDLDIARTAKKKGKAAAGDKPKKKKKASDGDAAPKKKKKKAKKGSNDENEDAAMSVDEEEKPKPKPKPKKPAEDGEGPVKKKQKKD